MIKYAKHIRENIPFEIEIVSETDTLYIGGKTFNISKETGELVHSTGKSVTAFRAITKEEYIILNNERIGKLVEKDVAELLKLEKRIKKLNNQIDGRMREIR